MEPQRSSAKPHHHAEFIDLDQIISEWAWNMFYQTRQGKEEKSLCLEDVQIYPDYRDVIISHDKPHFCNDQHHRLPKNSNLFRTSFSNHTDQPQEYTVSASRTTRSSCEVEIGKTFTHGGEVSLKLSVPGSIVEANAGFHTELALQRTSRQVTENELSWGIDSTIAVQAQHRATACIEVVEETRACDFSVHSTVCGRVRATVTNVRDNNALLRACAADVRQVFKKFASAPTRDCYLQDDGLHLVSTGSVNFRFGVEQVVVVEQQPL